ncbi:extracellular solute-binding protein [Desertihabitans brevis]|uniref:Extracellular solute-binding protein n=1 Tax=Desertihabitans brevis TaxID=2268447 RepID=A0A367YX40_9ACTN|nr:extracellular solute-binding protein [Desertihabitans brevis]RCK70079.1 extracellular solute-binding protein [Desertihabitans brevis]
MTQLSPTRRGFLSLLGAAGAAGALTACSGGGQGGGPTEIRFAYWGNDTRQRLTEQAVEVFHSRHPDIRVKAELGQFQGYFDKLATQTAANDMPDVFQMNEKYLAEYAQRGALLDLSELDTTRFSPGTKEAGMSEGALYGVNAGVNAPTMMTNPRVFEEAGVELPDDTTWTWDDLRATSAAITEATGGTRHGLGSMAGNDAAFHVYLRQRGASLYTDRAVGFPVELLESWFADNLRLQDEGCVPPAAAANENGAKSIDEQAFANGGYAVAADYSNLVTQLEDISGEDLRLLRYPSTTGRAAEGGLWLRASMFWSASARTRQSAAVLTFIDFLANSTACGEVLLAERGLPANADVLAHVADRLTASDLKAVAYLEAIEPELGPTPPLQPVGGGEFPNVLSRYADEVMFGRMPPAAAATQLVAEIEASLAG